MRLGLEGATRSISLILTMLLRRSLLEIAPLVALAGWLVWGAGRGGAASPDWSMRTWQVEEGLQDNSVSSVACSPSGYLWVVTRTALARFDGVSFQPVRLPSEAADAALALRVSRFTRDTRLWTAADGGGLLGLGSGRTNLYTAAMGLSTARPVALEEAGDGAVWVGYTDGTVCRVSAGKVTRFAGEEWLPGAGACWLAVDAGGQLWFAKAGRIGVWRGGKFVSLHTTSEQRVQVTAAKAGGVWVNAAGRVFRLTVDGAATPLATLPPLRAGVEVRAMYCDADDGVWIGTSTEGLFHCSPAGAVRVETSHPEVLSITQDHEGNFWVGTGGGGLNRIRPRMIELHGTTAGLPIETVRSVCEDQAGRLWAATLNGELACYERAQWRSIPPKILGEGVEATCVIDDGSGGVWVGTRQHGLGHLVGDAFTRTAVRPKGAPMAVRALHRDRAGAVWTAVEGMGPVPQNGVLRWVAGRPQWMEQPAGSRVVRAVAEDTTDQLWMGTPDGLLLRVADCALVDETARVMRQRKPIRSLLATPDGSLWIGLAGVGLVRWKDGVAHQFGSAQGLPDGFVSSLVADDHGALWAACSRGLFRVPLSELEAVASGRTQRFTTSPQERLEGLRNLQGNYGHWPGATRSRDGRLWLPMRTGLAVVRPSRVPSALAPPPVYVDRLLVDGQPMSVEASAPPRFRGDHRQVTLEFSAPAFSAPENVVFRHKLVGWDEQWSEATRERRAIFPQLSPGKYEFLVNATAESGQWSGPGSALAFTVTPQVWQTLWFKLSVTTLACLSIAAGVRHLSLRRMRAELARVEREAVVHRERARIAKDIHDDLGASLTHITLLGELVEQELAAPERVLTHARTLSQTARQLMGALDETVWAVTPSNDTLAHLLNYTGQFAAGFLHAAGVRCRVDFPLHADDRPISAEARHHLFMAVKEALHNVVKHSRATTVNLSAAITPQSLRLTVTDDGRGFTEGTADAQADGLCNIRQRLAEIGGACNITSEPGRGTTVLLEFPWTGPPCHSPA